MSTPDFLKQSGGKLELNQDVITKEKGAWFDVDKLAKVIDRLNSKLDSELKKVEVSKKSWISSKILSLLDSGTGGWINRIEESLERAIKKAENATSVTEPLDFALNELGDRELFNAISFRNFLFAANLS